VDALSDPEFGGTVFAPTNAAFEAALSALGITLEELVANVELLTDVLLYHVSPKYYFTFKLYDGVEIPTLLDDLTLGVDREKIVDLFILSASADPAEIVAKNVKASNGIVQVIDTVLLPPL